MMDSQLGFSIDTDFIAARAKSIERLYDSASLRVHNWRQTIINMPALHFREDT